LQPPKGQAEGGGANTLKIEGGGPGRGGPAGGEHGGLQGKGATLQIETKNGNQEGVARRIHH